MSTFFELSSFFISILVLPMFCSYLIWKRKIQPKQFFVSFQRRYRILIAMMLGINIFLTFAFVFFLLKGIPESFYYYNIHILSSCLFTFSLHYYLKNICTDRFIIVNKISYTLIIPWEAVVDFSVHTFRYKTKFTFFYTVVDHEKIIKRSVIIFISNKKIKSFTIFIQRRIDISITPLSFVSTKKTNWTNLN